MKLICNQCGYRWPTRKEQGKPKSCPACKRYDWQEPKKLKKTG